MTKKIQPKKRMSLKSNGATDEQLRAVMEKMEKDKPEKRLELGPLSSPPTPQDVSAPLYAFPARVVGTLLPEWDSIPDEFKGHGRTAWNEFVDLWFTPSGLPEDAAFHGRPGIDAEKAFRHLSTCMRSFQPKHQHKMAGCAYLASCFFEKIVFPTEKKEFKSGG